MMEFVVQTKDLCKAFAGENAVNHVNINIRRGDIYGFIGKTGCKYIRRIPKWLMSDFFTHTHSYQ
jgi:ABC-type uncharacterized transport system ATPase subunit